MYIAVLGCTLAVTVIGLSAVMVTRIERRSAEGAADMIQARLYAQSAIEVGLLRIRDDLDWRVTYPSGEWFAEQPIGTGTCSLEGIDPGDNNLKDADTDPLLLTGVGIQGDARYQFQVTLLAETDPLTCLEVSLQANTDAIFQDSVTIHGIQIVSANNVIQALGHVTVYPDMESVNGFVGALGPGATTSPTVARDMPDPVTVYDYYVTNGTPITVPGYVIEKQLLSPTSNPYGPTDPQGIYVVDCGGQRLTISNARIVGTLVVLRAGSGSEIRPTVNLEPAVANFPVLLVDGSFMVDTGAGVLSESTTGINFNPPGTRFDGVEDSDLEDTYPAVIKGLVYVSNDLTTSNDAAFEGVVVVGNTFIGTDNVTVNYQGSFLANPPPGFTGPPRMYTSPGTWKRVVD